jgi:hypothetical protein
MRDLSLDFAVDQLEQLVGRNNPISRRALFAGMSAATVGSLGLIACTNPNLPPVTNAVPAYVAAFQAILSLLASVVPQLQTVPGFAGNTLTSVETVIAEIQKVLTGVSNATTATAGEDVLTVIEGYINVLAPMVLPFVALIPGGSFIGLIIAALPAIEGLFNFFVDLLSPTSQQVAATSPALTSHRLGLARGTLGAPPTPAQSDQALALIEAMAERKNALRRHR